MLQGDPPFPVWEGSLGQCPKRTFVGGCKSMIFQRERGQQENVWSKECVIRPKLWDHYFVEWGTRVGGGKTVCRGDQRVLQGGWGSAMH